MRKLRVYGLNKMRSTSERLRIIVNKSNKHFRALIVDDMKHCILVSSSTITCKTTKNKDGVVIVARDLAKKCTTLKTNKFIFDRNNYQYVGKIKLFCEELRKAGLKF